jgi:superfamily I DNA/RNA helicase
MDVMVTGGLPGGAWLMFGDFERQALYGGEDGRSQLARRASDPAPCQLTWNCRNTPRIGNTAVFLTHMKPGYRRFRRPDDGFDPEYLPYEKPEQQQERLVAAVRKLLDDNFALEEITILSPRRDSTAQRCTDQWLSPKLGPLGRNARAIQYGTIHAFKGLDAPAVILTDIDDVSGAAAEALLYVGLTRATDRLVILGRRAALRQILETRSA